MWATSVPIFVFLGLSVLDFGPMYATDVRHCLMPPPIMGGDIIRTAFSTEHAKANDVTSQNCYYQIPSNTQPPMQRTMRGLCQCHLTTTLTLPQP